MRQLEYNDTLIKDETIIMNDNYPITDELENECLQCQAPCEKDFCSEACAVYYIQN